MWLAYDSLADPTSREKHLKDNKHDNVHLTLKICSDICPWKYLFLEDQSFLRASLLEIFSGQMEAIIYLVKRFDDGKPYQKKSFIFPYSWIRK